MSEWLDIMLGELDQREQEAEEARAESERRDQAAEPEQNAQSK